MKERKADILPRTVGDNCHGVENPAYSRERVIEIGEILAAGLMRVVARKSSQIASDGGESSLDILPAESGHPAPITPEKA